MRLFRKRFDFSAISINEIRQIRKGDIVESWGCWITHDGSKEVKDTAPRKIKAFLLQEPIDRHQRILRLFVQFTDTTMVFIYDVDMANHRDKLQCIHGME